MLVNDYLIGQVRPWQAKQLKTLFDGALESDFGYFPAAYIDCVRRQNSLVRLSSATIKADRLILGLWIDHVLAGYVIAKLSGSKRAYIFWLYVATDYRGQGLGNALLDSAMSTIAAKKIKRVDLVTHNRKDFYLASGFVVDSLATNFVGDVDVYMMSRELV